MGWEAVGLRMECILWKTVGIYIHHSEEISRDISNLCTYVMTRTLCHSLDETYIPTREVHEREVRVYH